MAVVIREFHDILRALETHPEWREELRRYILSDDFLALPRIVRELAEAQKRTEQRVSRLEQTVQELIEAHKRAEERLARLEQTVQELIEAQKRTEFQIAELVEAQKRTQKDLQVLRRRFDGHHLEEYCRNHPYLFYRLLRRPTVLSPNEVANLVEDAVDAGTLTEDEAYFLAHADLIVRGYHRRENTPLYLAIEISVRVDTDDVERATQRSGLLVKAGYSALPVVVGESLHELVEGMDPSRRPEVILVKMETE